MLIICWIWLCPEFMDIIVDETEIIPYEIYRRYISGKGNRILV